MIDILKKIGGFNDNGLRAEEKLELLRLRQEATELSKDGFAFSDICLNSTSSSIPFGNQRDDRRQHLNSFDEEELELYVNEDNTKVVFSKKTKNTEDRLKFCLKRAPLLMLYEDQYLQDLINYMQLVTIKYVSQ